MCLNLLERVEHDTYDDEQRCATEELGKLLVDGEVAGKCRQDGDNTEEQ